MRFYKPVLRTCGAVARCAKCNELQHVELIPDGSGVPMIVCTDCGHVVNAYRVVLVNWVNPHNFYKLTGNVIIRRPARYNPKWRSIFSVFS